MSTQIQHRRGTTTEHQTFVGASGEITVDTVRNVTVVHDGVSLGGHPSSHFVYESDTELLQSTESSRGQGALWQSSQGDYIEADPNASLFHNQTSGGVKLLETGLNFTSLARFKDTISRGVVYEQGDTVWAAGIAYHFANDGNTLIDNLEGWRIVSTDKTTTDDINTRLLNTETIVSNHSPRLTNAEADIVALEARDFTNPNPKAAVNVATTTNIVLSGEQTIDDETTSASRVLVKDQTNAAENGIYVSAAGTWTRTSDMNTPGKVQWATVNILSGTANAGSRYFTTSAITTLETDNIDWSLDDASSALQTQIDELNARDDLPNIVVETLATGDIVFRDVVGNVFFAINPNTSEIRSGATSSGGVKIETIDDPVWREVWRDVVGNIIRGIKHTGEIVDGTGSSGSSAITHSVDFAFVEGWNDATTDAAISWVNNSTSGTILRYRVQGGTSWQEAASIRTRVFPNLTGKFIHTAILTGLSANTVYDLSWVGAVKTETFKTCPRANVKTALMSDYQQYDFSTSSLLAQFGNVVQSETVDLLMLNGDYVNDDGVFNTTNAQRWYDFLSTIVERYRNNGHIVPMIAVMGNHEGRNAGDTSNALWNGDGTPGMIESIMTWGYDTEQTGRGFRSAATLSVGHELFVISLETDHTVSLISQLQWFTDQLATNAPLHRNVVVLGHIPAFMAAHEFEFDPRTGGSSNNQVRVMRNQFWPVMNNHADKIRFYGCGHEHILTITEKLTTHYDSNLDPDPDTNLDLNDRRFKIDNINGVRQIGAGPWGGVRLSISNADWDETSTMPGHETETRFVAAMGCTDADTPSEALEVFGTGLTNTNKETWNIWVAEFSETNFMATSRNRAGLAFYTINENF